VSVVNQFERGSLNKLMRSGRIATADNPMNYSVTLHRNYISLLCTIRYLLSLFSSSFSNDLLFSFVIIGENAIYLISGAERNAEEKYRSDETAVGANEHR